jgi:hypothetical protein
MCRGFKIQSHLSLTRLSPENVKQIGIESKQRREGSSLTWKNFESFVKWVHNTRAKAVDLEAKLQVAKGSPSPRTKLERPCVFLGHQDQEFAVTFHRVQIARAL